MQSITINNSFVSGTLDAITSKSYAHRLLICAFISGEELSLNNYTLSKDIVATFNALIALKKGETMLDAGESGSTLRFLIPLVSALGGNYQIKMHGKLSERPNDDLYNALKEGGVNAYTKGDTVFVSGKLSAGEYEISADKSSQYLSGLIMALSMLAKESKIKVTTPISSEPYVDITLSVLASYGYTVIKENNNFIIKGKTAEKLKPTCEGDWSNSAFFLVAGAINGDITVSNLDINSSQGDKEIFNVLLKANADIKLENGGVRVKKSKLKGFTVSVENCPDLAPICAVLGAYCKGETVITDIERLRLKESDRVQSTISMLKNCGVSAYQKNNSIIIKGGTVLGGEISAFNDHRIVMSGAVLALGSNNGVKINGSEAVQKSYPEFFTDLQKLGGKISAKI